VAIQQWMAIAQEINTNKEQCIEAINSNINSGDNHDLQ
jgi:hypothetical protein